MAVIKAVKSQAKNQNLKKVIKYISEKAELVTGKDCNEKTAYEEMQATKEIYSKEGGRLYKHYSQNFSPEDKITPQQAHRIGLEFAEKNFKGHEVLVATHADKNYIHNHFVVNSVNFENGKKHHESTKDLERLKLESDKLCKEYGLSVIDRDKDKSINLSMKQYKALEKGESRQARLINSIEHARKQATSKADFIQKMDKLGYEVQWSDKRARVTYIDKEYKVLDTQRKQEGKKGVKYKFSEKSLANYGISKETISKEGLLNEFSRNDEKQRAEGNKRRAERKLTWGDRGDSSASRVSESKPNSISRQDTQNPRGEQDRPKDINQETRGERESKVRANSQVERDIQREQSGISRTESNKSSRDTKDLQGNGGRDTEERGKTQGNGTADKGHGVLSPTDSQSIMEGKSEAIRSTAPSDNRTIGGDSGNIPAGDPFGEILKSLSGAIQRANDIEKAKLEQQQQKALQKQQQKEKAPSKPIEKSRGWER